MPVRYFVHVAHENTTIHVLLHSRTQRIEYKGNQATMVSSSKRACRGLCCCVALRLCLHRLLDGSQRDSPREDPSRANHIHSQGDPNRHCCCSGGAGCWAIRVATRLPPAGRKASRFTRRSRADHGSTAGATTRTRWIPRQCRSRECQVRGAASRSREAASRSREAASGIRSRPRGNGGHGYRTPMPASAS